MIYNQPCFKKLITANFRPLIPSLSLLITNSIHEYYQLTTCLFRAHTIITIEFRQREMKEGRRIEKFSMINLVDLAGSEKVGKTNATGDRLKEGKYKHSSIA